MKTILSENSQKSMCNKWEKEKHWQKLITCTVEATHLTIEEKNRLEKSPAAEILAATTFLSGCRNPERMAVTHLISFIASIRCREVYNYTAGETLRHRLDPISHLPSCNHDALEAGMLLLELISLNDHKNDLPDDIAHSKQNPLIIDMDYPTELERITKTWEKLPACIKEMFGELYDRSMHALFWW